MIEEGDRERYPDLPDRSAEQVTPGISVELWSVPGQPSSGTVQSKQSRHTPL